MDLLIIFGVACLAVLLGFIAGVTYSKEFNKIEHMGTLKFRSDEDGTYMFLETSQDPIGFLNHDRVIFEIEHPQD